VDGSDTQLGWGLIGASDIAASCMIPALKADPRSTIVGVCSRSLERATSFSAEHGIPRAWQGTQELLADPSVDAVYISSVNSLHHDQTIAAADAGKHVLCEKPLAVTLEQAREMVGACESAGVTFAVNHHLRASSANRAAREAIRAGRIGRPLSARVLQAAELAPRLRTWRINDPGAGAGVALDIAVHEVDLLRFLLGEEISEVAALTANQGLAESGIDDVAIACLRFRSGLLATLHAAFNAGDAGSAVEIYGSEGVIVIENAAVNDRSARASLRRHGAVAALPAEPHQDQYERQVAAFSSAVLDGVPLESADGRDGFRSLEAVLALLTSSETRSVVVL
jgi:1,5-anhydro-D-fructose reductase (1,5-anhydro-D-mannitol-forming)